MQFDDFNKFHKLTILTYFPISNFSIKNIHDLDPFLLTSFEKLKAVIRADKKQLNSLKFCLEDTLDL